LKAQDILSYSFSAIKLRKLRAGLTTLGVVIGIAAIVALLSITQGLQATITKQLTTGFATDTLIVSPQSGGLGSLAGGSTSATGSDLKLLINYTQIINGIGNVSTSVAVIQKACYIKSGDKNWTATIIGVDFAEYADIYSSTFAAASGNISLTPNNETIVVGNRVSDPWENGTLLCNVNDSFEIIWRNATVLPVQNETYTGDVAAVLNKIGGFSIGGPSDYAVYIPLSQAQHFFGTDECSMIIVKLKNDDEATINSTSVAIRDAFDKQVSVVSATAVLNTLSSVFSIIELFLAGIAAISLLVAGIGIMNIMIVSLMERTREIGILKALGMRSRTVLLVFVCESVIIGLMGAVIGIGSGWVLAEIVALVFRGGGVIQTGSRAATTSGMTITPLLTPTVALLALGFGVGVSVVFALYPAWRASKLKPVEALRYE
jgi:putative ABC transport system permease protein